MEHNGKIANGTPPATMPPPTAEQVFRDHAPRVYNLARRMLGNDADAEDVTQDVLLQVVRKLDTFRGESNVTTWLHRVTVNAALAHRRKRANREHREAHDPLDLFTEHGYHARSVKPWSATPDRLALKRETTELIEKAISGVAGALPRRLCAGRRRGDGEPGHRRDARPVAGRGQESVAPWAPVDARRLAPHFEEVAS